MLIVLYNERLKTKNKMITTINKDILTVEKGVIVHSVNCFGYTGGLAGAIARQWPDNAIKYKKYVTQNKKSILMLGNILDIKVAYNLIVANLFGQYDVGSQERQTEYSALINGFRKIEKTIFYGDDITVRAEYTGAEDWYNELNDIYIPYKIGCGLGGADWNTVEEIIKEIFKNSDKNIYICKHE